MPGLESGVLMDIFDAFLFNLHLMIGHNATAAVIGQDPGDPDRCHLCHPEQCTDDCRPAHQRSA